MKYEIRQQVKTVFKSWMEVIGRGVFERSITNEYNNLVKENPREYFELIKIETDETCLKFTRKEQTP